jgi:hypothetical protein
MRRCGAPYKTARCPRDVERQVVDAFAYQQADVWTLRMSATSIGCRA